MADSTRVNSTTNSGTTAGTNAATRVDHVGSSGIFPASGPWPSGGADMREQGSFGHPDEREAEAWRDLGRRARSVAGTLAQGYLVYKGLRWLTRRRRVVRALITLVPFTVLIGQALMRDNTDSGHDMVPVSRAES